VVYELGCATADFLFWAEKYGPKKLIGYEISPLHVFLVKIKAKILNSKVEIVWKDFFEADISEADYIYLFLVREVQDRAWQKISKEGKKGALVIILSEPLSNEKPYKVFRTQPNKKESSMVYVYRVK